MTALLTAERFHPEQLPADSTLVPETPRFVDSLTLAATRAAIGCARMFVSHTLYHWNAQLIEDDALLAVTELVTHAVRATGVMDEHPRWWELDHLNLINVRLLGMDTSIIIEVWDSETELAESISNRWNYFHPSSGGKILWCELTLAPRSRIFERTQEAQLPLPRRKPRSWLGPTKPMTTEKNPELLRRVIDGLMKLDEPPGGNGTRY